MTPADTARLLRELAAGHDLEAAARAAGFDSSDQAARQLRQLAARLPAPAAESSSDLPPPPSRSPYPPQAEALVSTDGASRGNPGPASYGCVYCREDGTPLCGESAAIGVATNNVAEYQGLIAALSRLRGWGVRRARLRIDSQLVVRQMDGSYRVKDAGLKPLFARARQLAAAFDSLRLEHVRRADNQLADALANRALDRARDLP